MINNLLKQLEEALALEDESMADLIFRQLLYLGYNKISISAPTKKKLDK